MTTTTAGLWVNTSRQTVFIPIIRDCVSVRRRFHYLEVEEKKNTWKHLKWCSLTVPAHVSAIRCNAGSMLPRGLIMSSDKNCDPRAPPHFWGAWPGEAEEIEQSSPRGCFARVMNSLFSFASSTFHIFCAQPQPRFIHWEFSTSDPQDPHSEKLLRYMNLLE